MKALQLGTLLLLALSAGPTRAHASPARTPMIRVLREASPDIRRCTARLGLPSGRYVFRVFVETEWGRVQRVAVAQTPATLSDAQRSCLEAAFLRLQFPHFGVPERTFDPRVPRMRRATRHRPLRWILAWPVQLTAQRT